MTRYSQSSFYERISIKDEHCENCGQLPMEHGNGACPEPDPDLDEDEEEWDLDATPEDADWIKQRSR